MGLFMYFFVGGLGSRGFLSCLGLWFVNSGTLFKGTSARFLDFFQPICLVICNNDHRLFVKFFLQNTNNGHAFLDLISDVCFPSPISIVMIHSLTRERVHQR